MQRPQAGERQRLFDVAGYQQQTGQHHIYRHLQRQPVENQGRVAIFQAGHHGRYAGFLKRPLAGLLASVALAACASTSVRVTGNARVPIRAEEVRVYTFAPPSFQEVAKLRVSRNSVRGGEQAIQKVIGKMKSEAAKLGANGLLLEDFADGRSLSVGTGVGSDSYTHNGSISVGVGGGVGIVKKIGMGRAIYVAPATP